MTRLVQCPFCPLVHPVVATFNGFDVIECPEAPAQAFFGPGFTEMMRPDYGVEN